REVPLVSVALLLGWLGIGAAGLHRLGFRRGAVVALTLCPIFAGAAVATRGFARAPLARTLAHSQQIPDESTALAIFQALHSNIYRAFDYTREQEIYNALARSVDGPMLDTLYNQVYSSLVLYEEGGAVSRVKSVTPMESTIAAIGRLDTLDRRGFRVRSR